mgnify:CR=1 FL=1
MDKLIEQAREAASESYTPYSEYPVGAAIRTADGTVFTGCNVENENHTNTVHAEVLAISNAVQAGYREFDAIAVSSGERDGVTPCGTCRQTLAEFCGDDLAVYCDEGEITATHTLGELFPAR